MTDDGTPALEMWAGMECSLNRVGDVYHDQLDRGGHYHRRALVEHIASLGVRTVRFPVLWERIASGPAGEAAWKWADTQLGQLRSLGITPIVGLVHHGSGPSGTSLLDPTFPEQLARFARTVAERYPWVEAYTPINEPLTTARFSMLYGHWYPHLRDASAFVRAMLLQCRATQLAMQAIREVTPGARLVQTEDLGKTWSTAPLQYQADFENERRWLTFDLLTGAVRPGHQLWSWLRDTGAPEEAVAELADQPCPPDIVGVNHYLTSERFLDDRLERYPPAMCGGNERHAYMDIEAVRALPDGAAGPGALIREACDRYGLPVAVTEAHLACTREQQLRWLAEVWNAARSLRSEGYDVRAVTAWSIFGAFDWNSLVTRADGVYEPGAFDVRAPVPRPTAIARMVAALSRSGTFDHPVLADAGWWHGTERLSYGGSAPASGSDLRRGRPVLLVGTGGPLSRAFRRICAARGLAVRDLTVRRLPGAAPGQVSAALDKLCPWAVVHIPAAAGWGDPPDAAPECVDERAVLLDRLVAACAVRDLPLLTVSSALVFDGGRGTPYVESDPVAPFGAAGARVVNVERRALALPGALVVRASTLFDDDDPHDPLRCALGMLAAGAPVLADDDAILSPTSSSEFVHAALDLLIDGECGIWHVANPGETTWAGLVRRAARSAGLDETLVRSARAFDVEGATVQPPYGALGSERGTLLGSLDHALARYLAARSWQRSPHSTGRGAAADVEPFVPSDAA